MKVLLVTTPGSADPTGILADLAWLEPDLDVKTVIGAAPALVEIRTTAGYRALFIAPSIPHNEALALIASLRRDRTPIAICAIVSETDRAFFAPALTAGADDVLVLQGEQLVDAEAALEHIRQNRHVPPAGGQPRLRILYAGQDELAWNLVEDVPFAESRRATVTGDGACAALAPASGELTHAHDVLLIDEHPGPAHTLQVVKWAKAHQPHVPVVVLTAPAAGDVAGAALELGADEVVSKAGSYRRRLIASLHRIFLRKMGDEPGRQDEFEPTIPARQEPAADHATPPTREVDETPRLHEELAAAATQIIDLNLELERATAALQALRTERDNLLEAQAFERAMRARDRDELALLTRQVQEEREHRIVLENTLRQTEEQARTDRDALEQAHAEARNDLDTQVARAADRLHEIAHSTQLLQTRLERELAARAAERDRLMNNALVGHGVFTRAGRLVRCSPTLAGMLGFASADDAQARSQEDDAPTLVPDHRRLVAELDAGRSVDRVESSIRRADGRALRVLTSAVFVSGGTGDTDDVERLFVDLSDRSGLEVELRLARRLESAGRLAAEMGAEIDRVLPTLEASGTLEDPEGRDRAILLVRQLLAFSRHQAKPAGFLSLNDALRRIEPALHQAAGGAIELQVSLGTIEPVAAGEDDIEQLVTELVRSAAACLPFGGRLTLATAPDTQTTLVLRTSVTATAAGYGVLPPSLSPTLARLVARCGGSVQVSGEAGRASTLHVHLPS